MEQLIPFTGNSLIDLIQFRAKQQSQAIAYTHLKDRNNEKETITYQQLNIEICRLAAYFQKLGIEGERVILAYPTGLEYIIAYFAVIFAGGIAVPVFEPRQSSHFARLQGIIQDCKPALLISNEQTYRVTSENAIDVIESAGVRWLTTDNLTELERLTEKDWSPITLQPNDVVFLQYTSGSTGNPKGVKVTDSNLIHNSQVIARATQPDENFVCVSWLPPYHDMGLIGGLLQPLFSGYPCVVLSPVAVIQRPYKLLQAISDYKATISGGPNFIFETCVNRIRDNQIEGIDLSCWKVAFNGAEPIHAETLESFTERFSAYGFAGSAHYPCYGLAENTLFATGAKAQAGAVIKTFDPQELKKGYACYSNSHDATALVSSGYADAEVTLHIVSPDSSAELPERTIGEVWLKGKSQPLGYWERERVEGEEFFGLLEGDHSNTYFRTGDLGFIDEGQLFVTGRIKDLIIVRGKNHYPQDIELTIVKSSENIKSHSVAAFSYVENNAECVGALVEVKPNVSQEQRTAMQEAIVDKVAKKHDLKIGNVCFIKPGALPKTTSGKIQRRAAHEIYLNQKNQAVS